MFLYAARIVWDKPTRPGETRAEKLFSGWWAALGLLAFVEGSASVLGMFGVRQPLAYLAVLHASNILQVVALWALLYYVLYVYTGRAGWFWPLTVLYAFVGIGIVAFIQSAVDAQAPAVQIGAWNAGLALELSHANPLLQLLLAALIVPQLGALIAYFTILFKARDAEQRFRVVVVSTSLFTWLASSYVASATGSIPAAVWALATRFLALGAALAVVMAFHPPLWIRNWLNSRPASPPVPFRGLQDRVRNLV